MKTVYIKSISIGQLIKVIKISKPLNLIKNLKSDKVF